MRSGQNAGNSKENLYYIVSYSQFLCLIKCSDIYGQYTYQDMSDYCYVQACKAYNCPFMNSHSRYLLFLILFLAFYY